MAPWKKESWTSNGNVAVYIFCVLFAVWVSFQVWAGLGGPPPPESLNAMVMAALGVAISAKSVEKKAEEKQIKQDQAVLKDKVSALEDVAAEEHPEKIAQHSPPLDGKT